MNFICIESLINYIDNPPINRNQNVNLEFAESEVIIISEYSGNLRRTFNRIRLDLYFEKNWHKENRSF